MTLIEHVLCGEAYSLPFTGWKKKDRCASTARQYMHTAKKKPMHVQVTYKILSAMSSTIILDDQNLGVDKLTRKLSPEERSPRE